jgi:hypothetical protein
MARQKCSLNFPRQITEYLRRGIKYRICKTIDLIAQINIGAQGKEEKCIQNVCWKYEGDEHNWDS